MNVRSRSSSGTRQNAPDLRSAYDWPPMDRDRFLADGSREMAWKKYCGFLDFSIDEYTSIQRLLLKEQIKILLCSPLGQELLGGREPEDIESFQHFVPLTTYADYRDWFKPGQPLEMNEKVHFWADYADPGGQPSPVPFGLTGTRSLVDDLISALILAGASAREQVRVEPYIKLLISLQVKEISEAVNVAMSQRLDCSNLALADPAKEREPFVELNSGIGNGLRKGLDFVVSAPETIARMGENIGVGAIKARLNNPNPAILWRYIKACLIDRLAHRPVLAADLWKIKGIVCCGENTAAFRERIEKAWGVRPLEVFFRPEGGFMAVQAWNKQGLTFIPYRNFYEFIPLAETRLESDNSEYQPAVRLMQELKCGEVYELVISNFHGGPFLRYRTGCYLRVTALHDAETGVNLPQFEVYRNPD